MKRCKNQSLATSRPMPQSTATLEKLPLAIGNTMKKIDSIPAKTSILIQTELQNAHLYNNLSTNPCSICR